MRRYISVVLLFCLASVNCSKLPIGGRIVGGKPVNIKNFSYQAGVYYNGEINCGGTIISLRKILTAAHCTNGRLDPVSSFTVRTGSSNLNQGHIHQVERIKQHPNFDAENFYNDISILILTASMWLTFNQWPTKLAVQRPPVNTLVVVSGWGRTSEYGELSTQLLATNLNTISQENCTATYRQLSYLGDGAIVNTTLCAAAMDKDACQGDSGGPLVNVVTRRLVGVVSWGIGCATELPGVYTLVSSYRSFTESM